MTKASIHYNIKLSTIFEKKEEGMAAKKYINPKTRGTIVIHEMAQDAKTIEAFRKLNQRYGEGFARRHLARKIAYHKACEELRRNGPWFFTAAA
ncbi:MAG: hypothetical protein NTW06_01960 [Candidatus Falkowbacteria bacterium]|nr:hypothetical protein [Candidatus Falkowbacteria bacterium]